ncbi:OmpH family outer membrane protein [Hufsiella ginkgonis]|uniref:OmpH family outer membrane protein n=1 Tax=Hufsiella ginkgonis TaxID=2695274 RepID=A0A7K1Y3B1_9SPHI|nr:OmpH family outer membrane protein [Hufsiella ginkgonis]MXV17784.1 OmpH family outer membrane protein [Hufsiella ginkgonis]
MKKFLLTIAFIFGIMAGSFAQRFAYVDTEYILKHIPEYNSAKKQMDALSAQWQKDVDARFAEIEKLYKAYQADQVLLSDEMRKRRENEIIDKEKAAKDFQSMKFGYQGDLYKENNKLIKPIQDKVAVAVRAVAENRQLDMVIDKNSEVTLLYISPRLDVSNDVITRLGYKPGTFIESK